MGKYFLCEQVEFQIQRKFDETGEYFHKKAHDYSKEVVEDSTMTVYNEMNEELKILRAVSAIQTDRITGEDALIQLVLSDVVTTNDVVQFASKVSSGQYDWLKKAE